MSLYSSLVGILNNKITSPLVDIVRYASKKSRTSTRIRPDHRRPKHRGVKIQDGHHVHAGVLVATQLSPRFFPGLNVGFGKDKSLYTMEAGKVAITSEKVNPNWNNHWIKRSFGGREGTVFYKKYFNILPYPQHKRFKLVDEN